MLPSTTRSITTGRLLLLLFIALPLTTVFLGSFRITQPVVETVQVESCTAGFLAQICTTEMRTIPLFDDDGEMVTTTEWSAYCPIPAC